MLEFSSDRSSLENALRVLGKAQTLFGKVIDDKALENRVENMLQECITMTFSTKTVTDSTPRTIKKGSETPHRFSIFADKKSPHKHAMGYNDKFKSLKTNSGSQYMIKTQRGRPQSSHKESSPLIHSSKSKHLKVANIHSEYFVQVGAGKMTLNKMRSYQTEKGTKERLPASFQDHGRVSRDTSFKVNTAENSYFKNGDRKRPSTSRGDVDKDCGECSRRDSIFKREQESKTKSIAVTRKSDSNSVKISDPVVQEGKAERKLRYHHLLETVKNQEREIEVLRLQQAANAVASKEIATLITQLATMNQQNRQSPTQGHHVFQNQDGPYPAIQIMHPDNSYYGQSGGQSMQAHMYIQGSMMDRIYYQQHSEYPTMDARQGVYQDMSSDPNAMYDSQPTLAPKYGRDRMDDSTIVKRGKRLLNFPLQLNVRRLRDSILAESLTVSQSILLFVGIARLSLTARKDEFDQLTISLRAQYIRKLGSAYEIDVDLLNDNGHSKKDYMLRGSDYNEIDFFKFVNKLPNYCVDIAPYDQLMSDHLEYLLTKVLRYFIIINMNDEDMYMQPVLSKSLVPINEDKKISLKFCGVQFGVELLHRNANSFFVNFMSETHHIRSHLYMDWETFDCYFDYYHDEQDPKQMASLLNTIVDGEEIDRDALKRDFTHREISVDRADLSDTGQFEDLLKDMMVKAAYIVEADFSWSFESSNEIYFCVKALNSPLENYVIMVFVNDSLEKKITVTYYYCYSLMCRCS